VANLPHQALTTKNRFLVNASNGAKENKEQYRAFAQAMDDCGNVIQNKKYFFEQIVRFIKQEVCARNPKYKNLMFLVDDFSLFPTASVPPVCFQHRFRTEF